MAWQSMSASQNTMIAIFTQYLIIKIVQFCSMLAQRSIPVIQAKISFRTFIVARSTIGTTAGTGWMFIFFWKSV